MWRPLYGGGEGAGEEDSRLHPCGRHKHSATLVGGDLWVLAGRSTTNLPLRDLWKYSFRRGVWTLVRGRGEVPPALQEHSAVARLHLLYVFGGELAPTPDETPLWTLNTQTLEWRKVRGFGSGGGSGSSGSKTPRGRRGHSAHALPDCMLLYGGYIDLRGSTSELWAFHYEKEQWQSVRTRGGGVPAPARHRHAAALLDGTLYVHGGMHDLRACADLWKYDIVGRQWSAVRCGAGPGARAGHAAAATAHHLYIFGGETDSQPTADLWRFHFQSETWQHVAAGSAWPAARVDGAALLLPAGLQPPAPPLSTAAAPARPALWQSPPQPQLFRDLSRYSKPFTRPLSRPLARPARCSYIALDSSPNPDSRESLIPDSPPHQQIVKSRSAYIVPPGEPQEADEADNLDVAREPTSMHDFGDLRIKNKEDGHVTVVGEYTAVRFRTTDSCGEEETSDYASAERVGSGFCNPHYMQPTSNLMGTLKTPDSGLDDSSPGDIELQPINKTSNKEMLLLVGGKEQQHAALLRRPLALWTCRLR